MRNIIIILLVFFFINVNAHEKTNYYYTIKYHKALRIQKRYAKACIHVDIINSYDGYYIELDKDYRNDYFERCFLRYCYTERYVFNKKDTRQILKIHTTKVDNKTNINSIIRLDQVL